MSQATLLRKLTLKSFIGFGEFKIMRVQELIDLKYHAKLIRIYYSLSRIDFAEEVKSILKITPERSIIKPGKKEGTVDALVHEMVGEIVDERMSRIDVSTIPEKTPNSNLSRAQIKAGKMRLARPGKRARIIRKNKYYFSKIANRTRNQKRT